MFGPCFVMQYFVSFKFLAIILIGKRELVAYFNCFLDVLIATVIILWLFLTVLWVRLWCVIVVFSIILKCFLEDAH